MLRRLDKDALTVSIVTMVAAFFLWDTPLLYPLKLFVVLLHEISHGFAALLTGGSVRQLQLFAQEGGVAYTAGGNRFLILSAGYLGSSLWGAALLTLSTAQPMTRRLALYGMGAVLGLIALFYVRDLFTFSYVALSAAALWLMAGRTSTLWHHWTLYIVGTVSCLYAVVDIGTDILAGGPFAWLFGPYRYNDAQMLAEITWIPAFIWGLLWVGIAVATYVWCLRQMSQYHPELGFTPKPRSSAQRLLDEIERL
jgi:hypothetical protein